MLAGYIEIQKYNNNNLVIDFHRIKFIFITMNLILGYFMIVRF